MNEIELERNYLKPFKINNVINLIDAEEPKPLLNILSKLSTNYKYIDLSKELKTIQPAGPSQLQIKSAFEKSFFNEFYKFVELNQGITCLLTQSIDTYSVGETDSGTQKILASKILPLSSYIFDYVENIELKFIKHDNQLGIRVIDNHDLFRYSRGNTVFFNSAVLKNKDFLKKLFD